MARIIYARTVSAWSPQQMESGFTLTEMAVVLAVVALLIGGLILPLTLQQELRARQTTEKVLQEIREALLGFAVINGRLPRPATSATDGAENPNACTNDAGCTGFIPWSTLGVPYKDAWGKMIRYSVTPAFANGNITLNSQANRVVLTRDNSGNPLYLVGQDDKPAGMPDGIPDCDTPTRCTPAVIFSHGKNRWGTTESGVAMPDDSATNTDEDTNNNGPAIYFSRIENDNVAAAGGEFDDMVIWLPTTVLINRLIASQTLP